MTPEGRIKEVVKQVLKQYKNVWYFMPVSGGYGKQGIHDFICCVNGKFLSIECKAGGKATPLQQAVGYTIQDAGGTWMLFTHIEQSEALHSCLFNMGAQVK